uniref:RING-type E3 ubiquitin transferase (cysteine targeting) n=1 Tax=Spongospora subterranea TaxID=70186 RepID=A0A0H5R4L0_9EUKA|eukprot:CRZ09135.1 hypothetical protein [Spongospora subterranea]
MDPESVSRALEAAAKWGALSSRKADVSSPATRINRVNQLDALQLDSECASHIWASMSLLLPFKFVDAFTPELRCIIASCVFFMTLWSGVPSPGQVLQNLKPNPCSIRSLSLFSVAQIVIPYLFLRFRRYLHLQPYRILLGVAGSVKLANLVAFLYGSAYRTVTERVAGITYQYRQSRVNRQITFDFMNQELIWAGASDFLLFIVPLLNTHKLQAMLRRLIGSSQSYLQQDGIYCAICCRRDPICVPSVASCGHTFCYYCLRGSQMADPKLTCPICKQGIANQNQPRSDGGLHHSLQHTAG